MIALIQDLPSYVAGFRATGEVTKDDYVNVVSPKIDEVIAAHGHIHFLLELDTSVGEFTAGAWMQDALVGLQHLSKWKKMAIVSDQKGVEKITDMVSFLMPGESKGFSLSALEEAKAWVSTEN